MCFVWKLTILDVTLISQKDGLVLQQPIQMKIHLMEN